jgi:hypothetical protein
MNYQDNTAGHSTRTPAAPFVKNHCKPVDGNRQGRLNKAKMLYPIAVLDMLGIKQGKANRGGYWILRCPYHKNGQEKKASLHLHQVTGHFKCQACGEKGDIIKFYMTVAKATFCDAIKALGAFWEVEA